VETYPSEYAFETRSTTGITAVLESNMTPDRIDSFVDTYVQALDDTNAAVFAGAGLSIPAGLADWKGLLRGIAADVGLDVDQEDDLVTVAQFHYNERGGRHRINQALINEFSNLASVTENHRILAALPIRTFWTTNYDTLIEESLRAAGKKPDVKVTPESLATTVQRRDAVVYKMHGDVSLPDKAVVTKDDYESYDSQRHSFSLALQGDLISKTFLFIGFSFSDPNLSYILGRIRVLLGENRREHYCLLRRVQRSDFSSARAFQYARAKQDLQVRDLGRYGIVGLLVDSYAEYTGVLRRIWDKFRMGRVFISGSAGSYAPWKENNAQLLVEEISQRLISEGFAVVSGFGLGIGSHVINGILKQLEREGTELVDDRMILRPFPFNISDPVERKSRWTAYREDILSRVGIALFVFGNKIDAAGNISKADGVEQEFRIAVDKGVKVVPIGCTGSLASELHDRVLGDFNKYYPRRGYKGVFEALARMGTPNQVAARAVKLARKLRDEA
jgi:Sir2- and TIR-associating SLOG family/SIR2-like domain